MNDTPNKPSDPQSPQSPLTDTDPMPFGKFKGKLMQDVNAHYLNWLWNNGMKSETGNVANYIRNNVEALKLEKPDMVWD